MHSNKDRFKIDTFKVKYLKRASQSLEKHLISLEAHASMNDNYKKGVLKETGFWSAFKRILHID